MSDSRILTQGKLLHSRNSSTGSLALSEILKPIYICYSQAHEIRYAELSRHVKTFKRVCSNISEGFRIGCFSNTKAVKNYQKYSFYLFHISLLFCTCAATSSANFIMSTNPLILS